MKRDGGIKWSDGEQKGDFRRREGEVRKRGVRVRYTVLTTKTEGGFLGEGIGWKEGGSKS